MSEVAAKYEMKDLMTALEAAQELGVHFTAVYKAAKRGDIISVRHGALFFVRSSVKNYQPRRNKHRQRLEDRDAAHDDGADDAIAAIDAIETVEETR